MEEEDPDESHGTCPATSKRQSICMREIREKYFKRDEGWDEKFDKNSSRFDDEYMKIAFTWT